MRRRTKIVFALALTAAGALALRIAAPHLVEDYVNRELASLGEYSGRVADVDLSLWRGAYTLRNLTIVQADGGGEAPFVTMPAMDLSMQWRALFRGSVVGEILMHEPVVNFIQTESEANTQFGAGVNWPEEVRDLFPFRLNVIEVRDGVATFRAPGIEADESLTISGVAAMLHNLTNVEEIEADAFATLVLEGRVMGNAPLRLTGRIDPNESTPTFDLNLALEGGRLVDVNPWLREFLNVDAQGGVFSMYTELAAADGRFEGYVRPIMEQPDIFDVEEPSSGPFQKAWEALVGFAAKILESRPEEQVATQIPFSGELENPDAGVLEALVNLLRNAFVAAFSHSLEGTISLGDVEADAACTDAEEGRC